MSIAVSCRTDHVISSAAMILIGLTGGVATGKSTVAKMFKKCGAIVIDADELAREVVQPGKPAWRDIMRRFGKSVLNSDRTINRQVLGQIVFHDGTELRKLEQIIHPRVAQEQARLTRQAAQSNPHAVVIYDVPLLFEAGIDKRVDKTVVVTADRETQIMRLKKRNGFTRTEALRRIRSQMPLAMKRLRADYVLDGTKHRQRLSRDVSRLFENFRSL
ncbi:MAG: dephospho-CoA kinase [Nitrospira sp.]|nr:dephospho-CoA kinase [Nitrospira sp.]